MGLISLIADRRSIAQLPFVTQKSLCRRLLCAFGRRLRMTPAWICTWIPVRLATVWQVTFASDPNGPLHCLINCHFDCAPLC